jgi:DNA-nicking Smr family endonuclease
MWWQGVLDLHGLHVCEAVELLDSLLPVLIAEHKLPHACILTGSGHHSGGRGLPFSNWIVHLTEFAVVE